MPFHYDLHQPRLSRRRYPWPHSLNTMVLIRCTHAKPGWKIWQACRKLHEYKNLGWRPQIRTTELGVLFKWVEPRVNGL